MATFPERVLAWINLAGARAGDLVLSPILGLPPLAGLLIVSAVTSVVMLLVIGRASDQARIAGAKRGIHAALFEIRLYNDNIVAVLRALGDALRHNATYFRLSLTPVLWMAIPLVLVIAQLQAFYGYAGLTPGVPALLKVEMKPPLPADASAGEVTLEAPDGIHVDTGAVRLSGSREILWRIVPIAPGEHTLMLRAGAASATKTLQVSSRAARRSPLRTSADLLDQLLYPSEPPLPDDSPFARITIDYPEPGIAVAGWHVHWMVIYVVLSMACAFALARRFGVTL